ncbi:MAG: DUF192 domain-containing protein [Patescibacteria group bacterium]
MSKLYIFLFIVIAVLIFPVLSRAIYKKANYTTLNLEGKDYKLLVADNRLRWTKGLSGIKKLDGYDGMLFVFPDKKIKTFWNYDTYLNLKIYWLDDDDIVGISDLPSIEETEKPITVRSPEKVNKVVELVIK